MSKTISLKVNNQEIPMNGFVQKILANFAKGFVDSLDKIPGKVDKIEILIAE